MNENVNGGMQQNAYTECGPAAAEDPNVYVTPVCRYLYVREVLHVFVEAPGVTKENVTVELTNERPRVLIILAVAKRQHRVDRHYFARILMATNRSVLGARGWDVSNGGRFISGFLLYSICLQIELKLLYLVSFKRYPYHHTIN